MQRPRKLTTRAITAPKTYPIHRASACALLALAACITGEGPEEGTAAIGTRADALFSAEASAQVSCRGKRSCDDGVACTKDDRCVDGVCQGTSYSCDDHNACTSDSCDGSGGCIFTAFTGSCDDGDPCTFADSCARGVCSGTRYFCDDGNACTADACDGAGRCVFTPNSAPCDDGNACTKNDTCDSGTCSGTAFSCDDANPCTADACDGAGGCSHTGISASCDDGNACTFDDSCIAGHCQGVTPTEICDNGIDDNCDGFIDGDDPQCGPATCIADFCPPGQLCNEAGYCYSHCNDGVWDGNESDVDCGGGICPNRCATGQHCWSWPDCASGICVGEVCQ